MFCLDSCGIFIQEYWVFPECKSVRAGHTDAAKPPTCPPPLSFSSHIPRHTLSLCFSPIGASMLPPHLCSFFPLRLSGSLFVLSSERIVSLGWRLKHLLNFIAVYIGLLSRELGVRVCVCVGACLNLIVCISIIGCVYKFVHPTGYLFVLHVSYRCCVSTYQVYVCSACVCMPMVRGVRITNTSARTLIFSLLSFSFIMFPWGRTHWKLL